MRATLELARAGDQPMKGEEISDAQAIPLKFLENILGELKHSGIVQSRRGANGGYWLVRDADKITLGDVFRAVEGPLASVRGQGAESLEYVGSAKPLQTVWIALRANLRAVLDGTTIAEITGDDLPATVRELSEPAEAWSPR